MAQHRREIKELQQHLRALPPSDQAQVLKVVMTPAMQLRLTLQKLWSKPGNKEPQVIAKAVRAAQRSARRERGHQSRP